MKRTHFDAIIIGTGQAGSPLARFLAGKEWNVAIIERAQAGGTCVNTGCTPTKTWVGSARIAHLNRIAGEFGIEHAPVVTDMKKVLERKNRVVEESRKSSEKSLENNEFIHLYKAEAAMKGNKSVCVTFPDGSQENLETERLFINTGAKNGTPAIPGLDKTFYYDSTSILDISEVPEHLIILGGSYIALEFGQIFRRLGSQVSIIERSEQILPREDTDVAGGMQEILEHEGIKFYLHSAIEQIKDDHEFGKQVFISQKSEKICLVGSHVLAALGRIPNTKDLRLENTEIETDEKGYIRVNEFLETNIEGVYALGDVNGGPAFTHVSYDDFRIMRNNLFHDSKLSTTGRIIPYCVFTDPELGRTGMTEKEARKNNLDFKVAYMPMTHVARAIESGETSGFMKALVDCKTNRILGASILSVNGGEISSLLHLAIKESIPYTHIRDGIFAHPTYAESLNNLFASFDTQ